MIFPQSCGYKLTAPILALLALVHVNAKIAAAINYHHAALPTAGVRDTLVRVLGYQPPHRGTDEDSAVVARRSVSSIIVYALRPASALIPVF